MKLAILTGGSRGLGRALEEQLRASGYQVIEFSRTAPHGHSVRLDLADPMSAHCAAVRALEAIDSSTLAELLFISNAGTLEPIGPSWRKTPQSVASNLNSNLVSAILVISAVVQHFRDTPCRKVIASISSGAAQKSYSGWSLYCAAKAGMESYVRAIALEEQANTNPFVVVNIDPGVIDTEMQAYIRESVPTDFPEVERFVRRKVVGGLAAPETVAAAILDIVRQPRLEPGRRYEIEVG